MNFIKKHKILTAIAVILLIVIISNATSGGKTTGTAPAKTTPTATPAAAPKVSLDDFYAQITNGMTKDQVNALSGGRTPSDCSETQSQYIGKLETCNYGGFSDRGLVMVQFTNDAVSSKSNNKF